MIELWGFLKHSDHQYSLIDRLRGVYDAIYGKSLLAHTRR